MEDITNLDQMVELERTRMGNLGPAHRYWLTLRAPERARRWLEKERARQSAGFPPITATRQGFASLDINDPNTADFDARNNSASEIAMISNSANGAPPAGLLTQFCTIAPNDAKAGKGYHLFAAGIYSTTGAPTLIFTPRWGSSTTIGTNVSLGVSNTITMGSGVSNLPWLLDFYFVIRTSPPETDSGTGKGHGQVVVQISTSSTTTSNIGKTAATIDTTGSGTAGCGLQVGITWGTASASNTLTPEIWFIQSLN